MLLSPIDGHAVELSARLVGLTGQDRAFFRPHAYDLDTIQQLTAEPGNHYYIYLTGEKTFAGYGMLRTFDRYAVPTLGCVVWNEYRGKGHGKRLVGELIQEARRLAFDSIKLKCHQYNRIAMAVYRSMGFGVLGALETEHYWMEYGV